MRINIMNYLSDLNNNREGTDEKFSHSYLTNNRSDCQYKLSLNTEKSYISIIALLLLQEQTEGHVRFVI